MKKTFGILFLISFLAILVVPLVSSAQIADCCVIRRAFTFENFNATTGWCVAATLASCTTTTGVPGTCRYTVNREANSNWGMICVLNTIYRVADLIFAILLAISILVILLGAYTFLTAGGSPDKVSKAQNYILYGLVGLLIAFLARAIPAIVNLLL